jgi:hypothetical protein
MRKSKPSWAQSHHSKPRRKDRKVRRQVRAMKARPA